MAEILIIEDDKGLNEGIAIGLGGEDYHFTGCSTLAEARRSIYEEKKRFDLVILDLNLPDGSGYEFLKEYRSITDQPVLVLTANDLEMNEVMGFELGANDYVTKGREVLLSRTEQKLLKILLENRGNTIPKERMLEKIWPDGTEFVEENALSVAVSRLRGKIEDNPSKPQHILNVYGIGYVWR